jgi:putative membrane protein
MRRLVLLTLALSAGLLGCSHDDPASKGPTTKVAGPGQHDRQWASKAYQLNLYQVEAGRLASSRSTTDRVRNLARMMTRDYTELGDRIDLHARQHHLALPREMDETHATYLQQLADVPPGPDFDRSYLNLELKTHHELIDLYEDEANKGEYPGARSIAQEALPDLYARERHIQQLRPGTWTSPAKPTGDERNPKEQPTTKGK